MSCFREFHFAIISPITIIFHRPYNPTAGALNVQSACANRAQIRPATLAISSTPAVQRLAHLAYHPYLIYIHKIEYDMALLLTKQERTKTNMCFQCFHIVSYYQSVANGSRSFRRRHGGAPRGRVPRSVPASGPPGAPAAFIPRVYLR